MKSHVYSKSNSGTVVVLSHTRIYVLLTFSRNSYTPVDMQTF